MNERGQPFSLNSEWEVNKEQNIAIAKKIDSLLLESPSAVSRMMQTIQSQTEEMKELQMTESIEDFRRQGLTKEDIPEDLRQMLITKELTVGHTAVLRDTNNKHKGIVLGVGYSTEARARDFSDIGSLIKGLPRGFNFPVYVMMNTKYRIDDYTAKHCFNFFGQGLKLEDDLDKLAEIEAKQQGLAFVDFIPQSIPPQKVVPLAPEDYEKINKMFEDIDKGLYQYKG